MAFSKRVEIFLLWVHVSAFFSAIRYPEMKIFLHFFL